MRIRPILLEGVRSGHSLHAAVNAPDTPLIGCLTCGAWTEAGIQDRRRKLRAPCVVPTAYGAECVRALRAGLHPTRNCRSTSYRSRHHGLIPIFEDDFLESSEVTEASAPEPIPRASEPSGAPDAFHRIQRRLRQAAHDAKGRRITVPTPGEVEPVEEEAEAVAHAGGEAREAKSAATGQR